LTRPDRLDDAIVQNWITAHPKWRIEDSHLVREIATKDYPSSVRLLQAQVTLAEGLDHHPNVTLGYRRVRFELWTHDVDALTQLDLDYAEGLDAIIADDFAEFVL
jgi:4a-hydroxytetrahydrobiopterin dehydratase